MRLSEYFPVSRVRRACFVLSVHSLPHRSNRGHARGVRAWQDANVPDVKIRLALESGSNPAWVTLTAGEPSIQGAFETRKGQIWRRANQCASFQAIASITGLSAQAALLCPPWQSSTTRVLQRNTDGAFANRA